LKISSRSSVNNIERLIVCFLIVDVGFFFRRQASVQAVRNGKRTAEDMARTVGLHVTKAVHIVEKAYSEKEGILSLPGQVSSLQNRLDAKTITVNVTLSITFELKARERHHHEKENKT
jgi:uncharacterized protein YggE